MFKQKHGVIFKGVEDIRQASGRESQAHWVKKLDSNIYGVVISIFFL